MQPAKVAAGRVLALMQTHRVATGVALASSALMWGGSSSAAEQPWREFSWRAPEGCPKRELVLHQLERLLQEHPVAMSSADVHGDIEREGIGWVLSLDVQVGAERRVRRVSAPSCDVLTDAFEDYCALQPAGADAVNCDCTQTYCAANVQNPIYLWVRHSPTGLVGIISGRFVILNARGALTSLSQIRFTPEE